MNRQEEPLVSIVMIAYNVEKYIADAIDSVLSQKVDFKYELVIGEDCSTDNTLKIALDYEGQHPEKIKVLRRNKNLGLTPNCIDTHNKCKGKYIALLDGDDFWTNEYKLQKQIDFLELHPEYSGCAHQSLIIKGTLENPLREFGKNEDCVLHIDDTITHRKFHTSSLVYRKEIWDKTGGIPSSISSNERAIYPMIAIFGPVWYLKDNMCVYRIAPTGLNSRITAKELKTDMNMLSWLKSIDSNFPVKKFRSFLHLCVFSYPRRVPIFTLTWHFFQFVLFSFSYFPKNLGDVKYGSAEFYSKFRSNLMFLFKPFRVAYYFILRVYKMARVQKELRKYRRDGRPQTYTETSKAKCRRDRELFFEKYCNGKGLDLGYGGDLISPNATGFDIEHGDATYVNKYFKSQFDFIYSSHLLEHLQKPETAIKNWWKLVKPGGFMILYIPHRDLYEKKTTLPSLFNRDHKHFFMLGRDEMPDTLDILAVISNAISDYTIVYAKICNENYYSQSDTECSTGEYSIEVVIQKAEH